MKILLIGAGQLGSRHLQSCLKLKTSASIFVVDECEDSLELTKTRASEIDSSVNHVTTYYKTLPDLKENYIDFLIIATGAGPRLLILDNVLQKYTIKFAILEKVLFQDLESYKYASQLIRDNNLTTFVNCPLRVYPFFKEIKNKYISNKNKTTLKYVGGEWIGIACNSIHYIDLMNFITDEKLISVSTERLDDGYIDSKRLGNVEFTGSLDALFESGACLSIQAIKGSQQDSIIEISNGSYKVTIDELSGKYCVYDNDTLIEDSYYDILYQSNLTHKMIEQIEQTQSCELIHFDESVKLHQEFIRKLLEHYNKNSESKSTKLPIT
jgi:hypothetical protein